jgi:LysM repeat protein
MTLRTRLTGLLATVAILAILVGLPVVLLALGSSPIPQSLPSLQQIRDALFSQDDGTMALSAVKAIAWAVWFFLTGSIALEILSRVRGARPPRLPGMRLPQSAARGLVATALLLFIAAPVATAPAAVAASASTALPVTVAATAPQTPAATNVASPQAVPAATIASSTESTKPTTVPHTVKRGESLWSIAAAHLGTGTAYQEIAALNKDVLGSKPGFLTVGTILRLPALAGASPAPAGEARTVTVHTGDTLSQIALQELGSPDRYPEIFEASQGTRQPDGQQLSNPDLIDVGWKLTIPAQSAVTVETTNAATAQPSSIAPAVTATATTPRAVAKTANTPTLTGQPTPAAPALPETAATPTPAEVGTAAPAPDAGEMGQGEQQPIAPWMLAGLTGGGAMLAGALLLVLRSRRRAQSRSRRPGRAIAVPAPMLAPVEKTIAAMGGPAVADVEFMDAALRRLAAAAARDGHAMPEIAAVELSGHTIRLHLSAPITLTSPWQGSADQLHWSLPAGTDLDTVGPAVADQPAPYPLLVTVGANDHGDVWLLNVEDLDVCITGDATFARDFARYLAAEIACNPWSHGVRADLVGVAQEVAPMNPDRLRVHTGDTDPAAEALADAVAVIDRAQAGGVDVATARARQSGADAWPARMLLIDAPADHTPALGQLLDLVYEHAGRTGTSVVVHGDRDGTPGVILRVTDDGRVALPHAGLDLVAVGLTSDEAQGCAALLTQSEDLDDVPIPVDEEAAEGWKSWSNEAGALREEHTLPRSIDDMDLEEPAASVLEFDDEEYVANAATTVEDLEALAPKVPIRVRDAVQDADPTLDGDLATWWAGDCPLPRLALLGPVGARTRGTPVTKRKPYYTEILAFLATRAHGATPEELAEAFTITPAKARDYVRIVRDWLGVNPRTGDKHLPDARQAPAAKARGVGVYQVVDVLVDVDLFRRLRVRGESRGPDGVDDLRRALRLVQGRPFDKLRDRGWHWLFEGDRLDQHMICAIVDVAHLVTTHSLQAGDLKQARLAAETAALAAPDEEIPRLDLAAVAAAEGHHGEAERILRDDVCNRSDDEGPPIELAERTQKIIRSRDWQQRARQAS